MLNLSSEHIIGVADRCPVGAAIATNIYLEAGEIANAINAFKEDVKVLVLEEGHPLAEELNLRFEVKTPEKVRIDRLAARLNLLPQIIEEVIEGKAEQDCVLFTLYHRENKNMFDKLKVETLQDDFFLEELHMPIEALRYFRQKDPKVLKEHMLSVIEPKNYLAMLNTLKEYRAVEIERNPYLGVVYA